MNKCDVIRLIHGAANHLKRVQDEYPYCDPIQVVKNYADIVLRQEADNVDTNDNRDT